MVHSRHLLCKRKPSLGLIKTSTRRLALVLVLQGRLPWSCQTMAALMHTWSPCHRHTLVQ
jgi:hypothetical protein